MNQSTKIIIAVGIASVVAAAILYSKKMNPINKKNNDSKKVLDSNKIKKLASDEQTASIKNIRSAIKKTNIDAFDGVSDQTFIDKFSDLELHKLYLAINKKAEYSSESEFKSKAPQYYNVILAAISKIKS